jgi:hypothetical protein
VFSIPHERIPEFEAWLSDVSLEIGVTKWRVRYYFPDENRPKLFYPYGTYDYEMKSKALSRAHSGN